MEYQNEANNWCHERCCCEFHCNNGKKLDLVYASIFDGTAKPSITEDEGIFSDSNKDIHCSECKERIYYYELCKCECSGRLRIYPKKSLITLCMKNVWIKNKLKTYLKNGDTSSITNLLNDWALQLRKQFRDNSLDIYGISFGYPHETDTILLLAEISTRDGLVVNLVDKDYFLANGTKVYFAIIHSRTTTLAVAKRNYIIKAFKLEFLKEGCGL